MSSKKSKPENPNPDYQDRDIRLRPLVAGLMILVAVTVLAILSMTALLKYFRYRADKNYQPLSAVEPERILPPGPLLQVVPREELAAHHAVERLFLDAYQWIDEDAGIARIPIERAMAILAEQGLPAREAADD